MLVVVCRPLQLVLICQTSSLKILLVGGGVAEVMIRVVIYGLETHYNYLIFISNWITPLLGNQIVPQ